MSTVTGTFKEIIKGKSGTDKKGRPWQAWSFTLADGKRYSAGFEQPKAATGDQVEFEVEEGGQYDNQMVKGSFKVTKAATKEESQAAKASYAGETAGRNQSIENQVALKAATEFTAAFYAASPEFDFDLVLKAVQKAYGVFVGCLSPTAAPSKVEAPAKPKAKKAAEPPPADEDENQDPDY